MGGYLVGFISAEIYLKYIRPQKHKFTKYRGIIKFEITLLFVIFVIFFGLLLSGNLVVHGNFEKPSIWLSLYASFYRNIWSTFGGFILLCMLVKMGCKFRIKNANYLIVFILLPLTFTFLGFAYEIACLPIFQILGRISFQSYLWHVTVLRVLSGFYRQPVYLNEFYMASLLF